MDPTLRNAVWQQLLDAERLSRYYGKLTDRHRTWQRIPRYLMGVSSVVGAAAIMFETDWTANAVYLPAFLLVIAAVVWDFIHDHGDKAAILHSISVECSEYETELQDLWRSVDAEQPSKESHIRARLKDIESGMQRITSRAGYAGVKVDEKLNEKAQKEGFKVISDRFS